LVPFPAGFSALSAPFCCHRPLGQDLDQFGALAFDGLDLTTQAGSFFPCLEA
jgi:hypothetical protein